MIFFPFIHFFSFIASIFLAVFVFYKDRNSLLNRTCSVLMLIYALWNFGDIILHNPNPDITVSFVNIMQNIAAIGWVSFASAMLYFSLVLSKKDKLLKNKWFLSVIVIIPIVFFYKQVTNCLTINPIRQSYGWSLDWAPTIWTYLFFIYYLSSMLLAVLFIYLYGRKTKIYNEKKQAKVIVTTNLIGIFIGTMMDVVMPLLGFNNIPPMSNLMVVVFASGVLYAIFKYRFLTITPTVAAENIIAAMDEFLMLLNQEGIILTANNATLSSLNYKQHELVGKPITTLFQDEKFKSELLDKILNLEVISNQETKLIAKNGNIVPVNYSSSPLKDNAGVSIGTVFIARDISIQMQTENELRKSKEKAEESDRLKTAFLANMSHEIRTPMNGILGFAELLKQPELSGEKQKEYVRIIEKSGNRMLSIINDIIDISKIEAGMVTVVLNESNLNDQIEYVYKFFKPEIEAKGMRLNFKNGLPSKESLISTDREKIFAILTNLIKNAIKYSRKGSIDFGYEVVKEQNGAFIQFFVTDTGIGIPKNRQEAIFERFIQADIADKMARQGAGLGLSITRAYVTLLGGKIWVDSEEGLGSTFYFTIPYIPVQIETVSIEEKEVNEKAAIQVEKLKILIAEDDETSEKLISISIKELSKQVFEARTGVETVEICRNNPDLDLILMDIQMPDMNGYEATRQIRKFNSQVKIIAQTALAQTGDREKAIEAGCNDYISKPIDPIRLQSIILQQFNTK